MRDTLNKNHTTFLCVVLLLGVMNVLGIQSKSISLLTALIEYSLVIILFFSNRYERSFYYYLAFIAITIESDYFVYGSRIVENARYSFLMLPVLKGFLRWIIAFAFLIRYTSIYKNGNYTINSTLSILAKSLLVLFVTGALSALLGLIVNENNVMYYPDVYPKQVFIEIIGFIVKASEILTAIVIISNTESRKRCSEYLQLTIIAVALTSTIGAILGFNGFYGHYKIVVSPVSLALTPMLILFSIKKYNSFCPILSLIAAVSIISVSFIYGGTIIGSKWYVIIGASLVCMVIMISQIKRVWILCLLVIGALLLVPLIIEPLTTMFISNDYISFKLLQALNTINIFGTNNVSDWYVNMGNSPLQRIDEIHNTLIEYTNKPYYAIFGKGLGGTTKHYTALLSWDGFHGDYSLEQARMGAYFRMHESLAVLFLQHGLAGIVFFLSVIFALVKRLYRTPWAAIALIWFFFYWDYGISASIGCVALVLALYENTKNDNESLSRLASPNNKLNEREIYHV